MRSLRVLQSNARAASLIIFVLAFMPGLAHAQTNDQTGDLNTSTVNTNSTVSSNNPSTTNNYNGAGAASRETPPPSAIAPSYMSNGQDTCLVGRSAGAQVNVFGLSIGGYKQDEECNRRRDAKILKDLNMNIAAVALMCQKKSIWISMFDSGTPCPLTINGKLIVGRSAYMTMKRNPAKFIPDYKKRQEHYDTILNIGGEESDEEDTDSGLSISERFRTSTRRN
tara:strand:+ start:587 stop:1258 length:672 start_codon:yes stop_codon:yes gene_type:complete